MFGIEHVWLVSNMFGIEHVWYRKCLVSNMFGIEQFKHLNVLNVFLFWSTFSIPLSLHVFDRGFKERPIHVHLHSLSPKKWEGSQNLTCILYDLANFSVW